MSSEEFSPKPTDLDVVIERRKKELKDLYRDLEPYSVFVERLFKVFDISTKKTDKSSYALIDINGFYLVFVNLNDKEIYYMRTSYLRKFKFRDPMPEEVIVIRDAVERHYKEIGLL